MRLTKSTSAYVQTPRNILDGIERILNTVATGDDLVIVYTEAVVAFVEEYKENCDIRVELVTSIDETIGKFLIEVLEELGPKFNGDIFFST